MTALGSLIRQRIQDSGPIDIGTFMDLALTHPEHGYYIKHDPFGAEGDFTTAPEVSQMFGELLGAWVADAWIKLGRPSPFQLVECGPGRGTLMADALRATAAVPGFHEALDLLLLEVSPILRERQRKLLAAYKPQWAESLASLPVKGPVILLANEFLDALPIRQLVFAGGKWKERVVILDHEGGLAFGALPFGVQMPVPIAGQEADIYEFSPARDLFIRDVSRLLRRQGGAALFVDYGHACPAAGDTLQAVKAHRYVPVLEEIGAADLTAHVDFAAVKGVAESEGICIRGPAEQGAFLHDLGIALRAQALLRIPDIKQKEDILRALHRLTSADQMGRLFKAMALCHDDLPLGGF